MENKEVATHTNGAMPAVMGHPIREDVIAGDILLPRIALMQGLSDLVAERKAQIGDIVRSTTAEIIGSDKKRVEIVPITYRNLWKLQERIPGKQRPEFRGVEPRNAGNDHLPWTFKKDGADWERVKVIEVFALMPADIETDIVEKAKAKNGEVPDLDKTLMPVVITFQSTGFKAGKAIATHFARAADNGVEPYLYKLSLGCYAESNDQGNFFVWDIEGKSPPVISAEETKKNPERAAMYRATIKRWADRMLTMVAAGNVRIDSDEAEVTPTASAAPRGNAAVTGQSQF